MSEMVERVARALQGPMVDMSPGITPQHRLELMARAAIEAMREPTVEMMNALDDGDEDGGLENGWRKAIDEALK